MSLEKYELVEIYNIKKEKYDGNVYDLEIGGENGDHSYNINGIIVHNSACLTRKLTGVGMPQLSAVIETSDSAHGLGAMVCGDGGITNPGDLVKCFGGGADLSMLGGMLAGHSESEQDVSPDGTLTFYGMSSHAAQALHGEGVKEYRASEGKVVQIPFRGSVENTIKEILGGIRSGMTYIGARKLKEIPKRATFVRVNNGQQLNNIFGVG